MAKWTTEDSAETYEIAQWGRGFVDVNSAGHLSLSPSGKEGKRIDLHELCDQLVERGIELPILLRFTDVVKRRVDTMARIFRESFAAHNYTGRYRGVYPIKVNQQRHLVEDLVSFARAHHMGLEAGSKPELMAALALLDDPEALVICNGYKDESYIEIALLSQKLGRNPILVIEKPGELDLILQVSERLGIRPVLGVRAKLSKPGRGRWKSSSGDRAKFGLTAADIVQFVERLQAADALDCLHMLHFHIGSQVNAIRTLRDAMTEAARIYVELIGMGAPMGVLDVGGGLGVDYDGSRSAWDSSTNYTEREYAGDLVHTVQSTCRKAGVAEPDIVTESGRAMAAYHSVLVFDVLGAERRDLPAHPTPQDSAGSAFLDEIKDVFDNIDDRSFQEAWHDATHLRERGLEAFNQGSLNLRQWAALQSAFWQVCRRIRSITKTVDYVPDELGEIERILADIYYCNFSVFQSVPDSWAIGQLFPCVPIHRLDEEPTRRAVLADLTCDSDGKLDRFIGRRKVKQTLELHPLNDDPYLLALFFVGAYQEILGDLHNLFGDTNAVHVSLKANGGYKIDRYLEGDCVSDVLGYVQYSKKQLISRMRAAAENAIGEDRLGRVEARLLMETYQRQLDSYTYLSGGIGPKPDSSSSGSGS